MTKYETKQLAASVEAHLNERNSKKPTSFDIGLAVLLLPLVLTIQLIGVLASFVLKHRKVLKYCVYVVLVPWVLMFIASLIQRW